MNETRRPERPDMESLRAIYHNFPTLNFSNRIPYGLLNTFSDEDIHNRFLVGASAVIIACSIIYYFRFSYKWISAEKRLLDDLKVATFIYHY